MGLVCEPKTTDAEVLRSFRSCESPYANSIASFKSRLSGKPHVGNCRAKTFFVTFLYDVCTFGVQSKDISRSLPVSILLFSSPAAGCHLRCTDVMVLYRLVTSGECPRLKFPSHKVVSFFLVQALFQAAKLD